MKSMSRSSKKTATRRDCPTTSCQTPNSQGGTMPAAPNNLNTMPSTSNLLNTMAVAPNILNAMPSTSKLLNTMPSTSNLLNSMPAAPNVLNTMPYRTQCPVTLATASNSSNMKFGQLSEELDNWVKELLDSERNFVEMVSQLNVMDRMVFQNISRLECLHQSVTQLSESQVDVNSDLNRIGGELLVAEEAVRNLENLAGTNQSSQATRGSASCSNQNLRSYLYNFMVQMNSNLNHTTKILSDIIHTSNYPRNAGIGTSPVQQIGCILNYHYECLVDIENAYLKCKTALENVQNQMMSTSSNSKC